jgi:hypothetical protein
VIAITAVLICVSGRKDKHITAVSYRSLSLGIGWMFDIETQVKIQPECDH